ncbi:MAG: DUF5606 domain-containing protein [Siphonobacter sp.]
MELLKEIAHISGKPGLYRILKPTRTGVIVETIDEKKGRTVVGANARVSVLKEISVYSDGEEGAKPLSDIFATIRARHGEYVGFDVKSASDAELRDFLEEVFPEFDRDKVYPSDIRKMITWYNLLSQNVPELFESSEETAKEEETKA